MQPRSRTRCRDPPAPPPGGGRHRRRSPPPPSPRHQRRPSPPQRRSLDRPPSRRYEETPTSIPDAGVAERRSRADILLEAGRLAAHYLVAQGVVPAHVLRAREDLNHVTVSRPEAPAPPPGPATYGRKRDDEEEDPRWRRTGDWGHAKGEDDRHSRRSGWDRRSHSFDDRRKYDVDRGARRTRDNDEPKRPPMSRSYSHNDRRGRASGDGRLDPRRRSRSRSRSRTRTRSYHYGGSGTRRDSDGRPSSCDLDHTELPDSAINLADGGEIPRETKVSSSVLVAEVSDSADRSTAIEDGETESEMVGLDHSQDVSEEEDGEFAADVPEHEDGEFAVSGFNDGDAAEMDAAEHQLSDGNADPFEFVEESIHIKSQLRNVEEEIESGAAPMDPSLAEPSEDRDGSSDVRDRIEAPRSEFESDVGHLDRDEQELPAWYRIFDLNVVVTPEGCEMPGVSRDSPADSVCDSVPGLAGHMNKQTKYGGPEIQGQDEHTGVNQLMEYGYDLSKYDLNNVAAEHGHDDVSNIQGKCEDAGDNHWQENENDWNKCDLNHTDDALARDNHVLSNEEIHQNHGVAENDLVSCRSSNEQILLKKNADEQDHKNHPMENEQMLVDQGNSEQGLVTNHVSAKQFTLSRVTAGQVVNKHQLESEPMHLHMGVHDVDSYNLNNGTNKHAEEDTRHLKDGETFLDQAVDGQVRVHNMGSGRTVPVIDLEDGYEQQPDTRDTRAFLESM